LVSPLFLIGLLLVASGLAASYLEVGAGLALFGGRPALSSYLRSPKYMEPLSIRGEYSLSEACHLETFSLDAMLRPIPEREAFAKVCLARLTALVGSSPANAFAWVVVAELAGYLGQAGLATRALEEASKIAPNEQWLAERRVDVAERYRGLVGEAVSSLEDYDLAMLVRSSAGIRSIAKRYVDQPDFRERVFRVVSQLSPADQARFIADLNTVVRTRTSS
jgi:hypothetical protein